MLLPFSLCTDERRERWKEENIFISTNKNIYQRQSSRAMPREEKCFAV